MKTSVFDVHKSISIRNKDRIINDRTLTLRGKTNFSSALSIVVLKKIDFYYKFEIVIYIFDGVFFETMDDSMLFMCFSHIIC